MEKKHYLGYIMAIFSGLAIIGSAFLSFTMTSSAKQLTQGSSLFDEILNFSTIQSLKDIAIGFYLLAIVFALVEIIYAFIALIFVKKGTPFRANLTVQRIFSCLAFLFAIVAFVILGFYLSGIESVTYNFNGIGPCVLVLASLILVESEFGVRKPMKRVAKKQN